MGFSIDQYPFIFESVSLIDALLPSREIDEAHPLFIKADHAQAQIKLDAEKRALYTTDESTIMFAAEKLLPKIFNVHENNIQG